MHQNKGIIVDQKTNISSTIWTFISVFGFGSTYINVFAGTRDVIYAPSATFEHPLGIQPKEQYR